MKTAIIALISFVAGALLIGFLPRFHKKDAPLEEEKTESHASGHETNEEGVVKLPLDKQALIGLQLAAPEPARMSASIAGFGRIIDPSPLIALISEMQISEASATASQKEFDRLLILHQQNQNVSTRVLETAEAALKRDQLMAESARVKLLSGWGRALLERPDLSALVRTLAEQTNALVRVDVSAPMAAAFAPNEALLVGVLDEKVSAQASFITRLNAVDPQTQGQSYLFLLNQKPSEWSIGTALNATVQTGGPAVDGLLVPRSAVIRSQGLPWIYVQQGSGTFARLEIRTEHPAPKGFFVTNGLAPTNRIVVRGAQIILSQELKASGGAGPEE